MKKLLIIILLSSLGFSAKLIVDDSYYCIGFICLGSVCTSGDSYYSTISDALDSARRGDEIVICPGDYQESYLYVNDRNLYIHSYKGASSVLIHDDSDEPIFYIRQRGVKLEGLSIKQDSQTEAIYVRNSSYIFKDLNITSKGEGFYFSRNLSSSTFDDINITSDNDAFYFSRSLSYSDFNKVNISTQGRGFYIVRYNEYNNFSDVNVTSSDTGFEVGRYFIGVNFKNSEFNTTDSDTFIIGGYFIDNNLSDINITSNGYGFYFARGVIDSNFTKIYANTDDDTFVVDGVFDNSYIKESNFLSHNGRGISIDGNFLNSDFNESNISSVWEGIYVNGDINHANFDKFYISGSSGIYTLDINDSIFNEGEINSSFAGIYSDKEINNSNFNSLEINASEYGILFSQNSQDGVINHDNNFTNLSISQTSSSDSTYSAIKANKKIVNNNFSNITINASQRGIWLATGGENNNFKDINITSSDNSGFIASNDVNDTNFSNLKVIADDYGFAFRKSSGNNSFKDLYIRVNNQKGMKFYTYSKEDYFYNIDVNGTKGIEFNISTSNVLERINSVTSKNEPIYFETIDGNVTLNDLNLTSKSDNCIYVGNLNANLDIGVKNFNKNDLNCSNYNGIQISNYSDKNLTIKSTSFSFNADSTDTLRALVKAKSLDTLYIKDSSFDGDNKRKGIYISSNINNFYVYNSSFENVADSAIYIKKVNNYLDIEDNNISNSSKYGIYIYSVDNGFTKGEIKKNIIKSAQDYGVDIFDNNENDNADFEIWHNCFFNNQVLTGASQAYTYDKAAKYDDGVNGNYWDDWNGSGKYQIDPKSINLYDNHPLKVCDLLPQNYDFNAVSKIIYNEATKDWDNNLTTQIVNKDFDIYILARNSDSNTSQEANITKVVFMYYTQGDNNSCSGENDKNDTICDDATSNQCPDTNVSGEVKLSNIKIDSSKKCVQVYIEGKIKDSDIKSSFSTDNFAIRPDKFDISNIPSSIVAAKEFNLTIKALDYKGNSTIDYNETLHVDDNTSVKVEYNITKNGCERGELNLTKGETFQNGETNATFVYNEVGELNITIKEINGSEFAKVDEDDTNESTRFIKQSSKLIYVSPHHFYIKANISNFDNNFTYLDNNLTNYSLIDINITAENENNETTKNYNTKCFAKDVDVNLTANIFRHNTALSKEPIYKIGYVDSNSSLFKNKDINFSVGESNFTTDYNGSALIKVYVNFDKNISLPENPFEFNLTQAEVNNSDVNTTYFSLNGKALFYYGYLNMNDVITSNNDFNVSDEFIIYDNNSTDTYLPSNTKEIIANWYLNTLNTLKDANISNFVVTKGYVYDDNIVTSVDIKVIDINETLNLNIKRNDKNIKFVVVHIIDTNASHLWFSKFNKDYNISKNSSCASHFCFAITWENNESNTSGVISGEVNGTKADVNNSEIKGVKLFR